MIMRFTCILLFFFLSIQLNAQQTQAATDKKGTMLVRKKTTSYVPMPELKDKSLKAAQLELESLGLKINKIKVVPNPYANLVLMQFANGKEVIAGTLINTNSEILLYVGDGKAKDDIGF